MRVCTRDGTLQIEIRTHLHPARLAVSSARGNIGLARLPFAQQQAGRGSPGLPCADIPVGHMLWLLGAFFGVRLLRSRMLAAKEGSRDGRRRGSASRPTV